VILVSRDSRARINTARKSRGVLFVSYDGMFEPLGQSQVLAYLENLSKVCPIYLISFEKPRDLAKNCEKQALLSRMTAAGISWHPMRYHKNPAVVATAWDIVRGIAIGLWLVVRHRIAVLHARSYVPSVMVVLIKRVTGARYVFDMRGFWADERVDGGLWPLNGPLYRVTKWFERRFLRGADHVVSLTRSAVRIIKDFDYLQGCMPAFTVIPTCADLRRFKPNRNILRNGPFVLGYVGTVGTWYMFDKVVATVVNLLSIKPDARFLVVNRSEHDFIRESLMAAGVPPSAVEITSASHAQMPTLMARMHAGVFFIKPVFSKQASAPTKLAEFLGCGVPCLGNVGVGDMADVLEVDRVGVTVKSFDQASLQEGLIRLLGLCADLEVSDRCVASAHRHFSLDEGVARYERIYTSLGA
jgi:glycosyltransferase involved in cell wall biosynthesis